MSSPPRDDLEPVVLRPNCRHIRHKLMYVDYRHAQRGLVDTESDTRVYWCSQTQEQLGPDGNPVDPSSCAGGDRGCFCGR